jgi:hypothetical protein
MRVPRSRGGVRSALLRPETIVAETVEFLRLADPGQGPREPS